MALSIGTNCGFVTVAPTADPAGGQFETRTIDGNALCCRFTAPATAVRITEMGWWTRTATEESNFELGVYDDDGAVVPNEAGTRLHASATNAKGTGAGWKVRSGLDWAVTGGLDYWFAAQCDDTTTTTSIDGANAGGAGYDSVFGATLPDPFGGGALLDADGILAIYAVWEAAAGGGGGFRSRIAGGLVVSD